MDHMNLNFLNYDNIIFVLDFIGCWYNHGFYSPGK